MNAVQSTRKKKSRRISLLVPMVIALLLIAGFQVYWIRDSYARNRTALEARTTLLFTDMMRGLQDSILTLRVQDARRDTSLLNRKDSTRRLVKSAQAQAVKMKGVIRFRQAGELPGDQKAIVSILRAADRRDSASVKIDTTIFFGPRDSRQGPLRVVSPAFLDSLDPSTIRSVNVSRKKDSSGVNGNGSGNFIEIITRGKADGKKLRMKPGGRGPDPSKTFTSVTLNDDDGQRIVIQLDSVFRRKIPEKVISKGFTAVLKREGIDVPFVLREKKAPVKDGLRFGDSDGLYQGYDVVLGNSSRYITAQLSWPITFSLFLVALTVFSFVILYRSLVKQYRLSEIKNDLISNITHELKTPIATVGVAIEALKNFNAMHDTKRTEEYLDISQQELQRLGLLVDKVLKLSMFENKDMELSKEPFDIGVLAREVAGSMRLQLEKQHARLTFNLEGDLVLRADRPHLQSVLFNLLDNALKYSGELPEIHVSATSTATAIEINVSDNGIGIPAAYRDKVFDKFFRVPQGDTHNAKGHGLGLSYVYEVVKQHGGTMRVESTEGKGSSFIMTIPK